MKLKQTTLATAIAATLALGMSGQASANVYAGSRLLVQDLTVVVTGSIAVPLRQFDFTVSDQSQLNGGVTAGQTDSCSSAGAPAFCSAVSPVLATAAANAAPGATRQRVDGAADNWDFFGPGTDTYANSDSEIVTAQLLQAIPTSAKQISETELQGSGSGSANTLVQSNSGFSFTFAVVAPGSLTLSFLADPDLFTMVNTNNLLSASAQADTNATFTLSGNGTFVKWTPDGIASNVSGTNCVGLTCADVTDTESLNNSIGFAPFTNPANDGISDDRDTTGPLSPDLGLSLFKLDVSGLTTGTYTLVGQLKTSVSARQTVPEPTTLALLGLGLAGLGVMSRRRK